MVLTKYLYILHFWVISVDCQTTALLNKFLCHIVIGFMVLTVIRAFVVSFHLFIMLFMPVNQGLTIVEFKVISFTIFSSCF